ncbi:hypothetical protein MNBD_BACTEROID03-1679 [hydrothermal vent metagenome]|uniref:RNA polymerase sigma factor 70 region 4 type 2 domain-containing protein n=1 Tax=hydrothermal vent metagenome TaxID=652676 RepID=A0A3B0TBI7_9ZZZZ
MDLTPEKSIWYFFVRGDVNAFSTLFKGYYSVLYDYGLKISGNPSLTEDCLQDFFVYLYDRREGIGEVNNIRSYLFVSFRRSLFKKLKKERKFTDYDELFESISKFEFSAEEIAIKQELTSMKTNALANLLNKLSVREREAVYLKYYSDLKTDQIARVMGISYQSVLNTLQKAFLKLRKVSESEAILQVLRG